MSVRCRPVLLALIIVLCGCTAHQNDAAQHLRVLYDQGVQLHQQCRYTEAMRPLKEAEMLITPQSDPLISGMVYMLQGSVLELNDYLWTEAEEKYQMAMPYFVAADDTLRMACCCRDMARMSLWRGDTVAYEEQFLEAIRLVSLTSHRLFYYDISIQYQLNHTPTDTLTLLALNQVLCDSFAVYRYAYLPVEYHLSHGRLAEAEHYLSLYAIDSVATTWSREQYDYLHSLLLFEKGQNAPAYTELQQLYLGKQQQMYRDGLSRTFAIARQYDSDREQHQMEQLLLQKRLLWLGMVSLLVLLVMAIVVASLIVRVRDARMAQINAELQVRRESLRRVLKQRVELTKQIQQSAEFKQKKIPVWLQQHIDRNTFANPETWTKFLQEYNDLYGNVFDRLQMQYPSLNEKDLQYIALATLGMDNNDISYLLGMTDRTIWNRRQTIKDRIGQSHANLDEWLQSLSCQENNL